jgi:hypothetical protein
VGSVLVRQTLGIGGLVSVIFANSILPHQLMMARQVPVHDGVSLCLMAKNHHPLSRSHF